MHRREIGERREESEEETLTKGEQCRATTRLAQAAPTRSNKLTSSSATRRAGGEVEGPSMGQGSSHRRPPSCASSGSKAVVYIRNYHLSFSHVSSEASECTRVHINHPQTTMPMSDPPPIVVKPPWTKLGLHSNRRFDVTPNHAFGRGSRSSRNAERADAWPEFPPSPRRRLSR